MLPDHDTGRNRRADTPGLRVTVDRFVSGEGRLPGEFYYAAISPENGSAGSCD